MYEIVCRDGHVDWWLWPRKGGCVVGGCRAQCLRTGRRKGETLEDAGAFAEVWSRIDFNGSGCWLWTGDMAAGAPNYRNTSPRRLMWALWREGRSPGRGPVVCGESRCIRPSHMRRDVPPKLGPAARAILAGDPRDRVATNAAYYRKRKLNRQ